MFDSKAVLTKAELDALQLKANPFPDRPKDGERWWCPALTSVLEEADRQLYNHGMVAVIGPSGSGKSSLLAQLAENLEKDNGVLVVNLTALDMSRLADWSVEATLFEALGSSIYKVRGGPVQRQAKLVELLRNRSKKSKQVAILSDDFHDATADLLKGLRRLREADRTFNLFGLVVAGQPKLQRMLHAEDMRETDGRMVTLEMPRLGGTQSNNKPVPNLGWQFLDWHFKQMGIQDTSKYFTQEGAYTLAELGEYPLWIKNLAVQLLKVVAKTGAPADPAMIAKLQKKGSV